MHDPMTVAHEIRWPWKNKHGYRTPLITIWHVDPETDGTDDSCGWFQRARHGNKEVLAKIRKQFKSEFKDWFNEGGHPKYSVIGLTLDMYAVALGEIYKRGRWYKKTKSFLRKHLLDIIRFAENPVDNLSDSINMKYGVENEESRIAQFASIIYADILRKTTPWYKHPRWHIHHWQIQFHLWQNLKRRFWDKCAGCGKRGFKGSPIGEWSGKKEMAS